MKIYKYAYKDSQVVITPIEVTGEIEEKGLYLVDAYLPWGNFILKSSLDTIRNLSMFSTSRNKVKYFKELLMDIFQKEIDEFNKQILELEDRMYDIYNAKTKEVNVNE